MRVDSPAKPGPEEASLSETRGTGRPIEPEPPIQSRVRPAADPFLAAAGILGAALGVSVLAGWHFEIALLLQVLPGLTPMAYNTAVSFTALGLGLGALAFRRRWPARLLAAIAGLIALTRLFQYLTGVPHEFETVLRRFTLPSLPVDPVPMAPNTATAFLLLALAVWVGSAGREVRWKSTALAFCGSGAAALGLNALFGYLTGVQTYIWATFKPMAVHTSAGLILLGGAIVAFSWRENRQVHRDWRLWTLLVVAVVGSATAISFWRALASVEQLQLESVVRFRSALPEMVLAFGLLLTALLALAVYQAQTARLRTALSDRLRAETEAALRALAASERKYRTLLETLPQKIAYKDRQFVYVSCNENYARDLNMAPPEIAGKTDYDFYPPELAEKYRADDRRVMDSGEIAEIEEDYLVHGQRRWVQTVKTPVRDERGAVVGVIVIFWDITDRKQAERDLAKSVEALEEERRRFRDVLDRLPAYVVLLTADYHVSFANRYFRERFGESDGRRCFEYLFGRSEPCQICDTYKVLKTGAPQRWEWTGPDGRTYNVYDFPFTEADGSTLILEMGIDITEAKRTSLELQRANAYNRNLIESSLDPLVTIAADGKITDVNRATESVTGCSRQELVGTDFTDYFSDPQKARDGYQQVFREGAVQDYELQVRRRDGRLTPVLYNASLYRDENGSIAGVFAAARDITDRKRAEEALEKKAQDLARSNADLEQFAYVASHDLQEPLRMVANFTQLLSDRYRDRLDADGLEFIAYAVDGATRMQRLIQDLLTYSRVGTRGRSFERTDCNEVLGAAVANLQVTIQENQAIVTHEELPTVMADASQLAQVFQNLVGNAIKFHAAALPRVHVSARREASQWVFAVRDNGIGIDAEFANRIFVIFQRLHSRGEYPGTGIGLALCKKIVERHGGKIWMESKPGQGATFFFTVPAA